MLAFPALPVQLAPIVLEAPATLRLAPAPALLASTVQLEAFLLRAWPVKLAAIALVALLSQSHAPLHLATFAQPLLQALPALALLASPVALAAPLLQAWPALLAPHALEASLLPSHPIGATPMQTSLGQTCQPALQAAPFLGQALASAQAQCQAALWR